MANPRTPEEMNEVNKSTRFSSAYQPDHSKGRKPGIRKRLKEIATGDGVITLPKKTVIEMTDEYIKLKLSRKDALAIKTFEALTKAKTPTEIIKVVKFITNEVEGPQPKNEFTINNNQIEINKTNVQYIVVTSLDQVPQEHRDKMLIQNAPLELPQPYNSEESVREKYGIDDK